MFICTPEHGFYMEEQGKFSVTKLMTAYGPDFECKYHTVSDHRSKEPSRGGIEWVFYRWHRVDAKEK